MTKYATMSLEIIDLNNDDLDWAIMSAARALAAKLEYLDPAMYGASAGKLVHAHACEMSVGDFMILDMSADTCVRGFASNHTIGERAGLIVPNHTHLVLVKKENCMLVVLCKGRDIPFATPGIPYAFTDADPSYSL